MATMRFEMTYHAKEERIDRLTACIQYLGFNEIIKEELEIRHNRNVVRKLTDTGIILICGEDGCLITGFMGTGRNFLQGAGHSQNHEAESPQEQ